MANFIGNVQISMNSPTTWYGYVYGATSNKIVITDYSSKIAK